ncbi:uncharacterized protein DS421_5g147500 [Arachis hypogaea]|nr:uncharacterized protein DS421_5g147500 [Arachis hypogaea]
MFSCGFDELSLPTEDGTRYSGSTKLHTIYKLPGGNERIKGNTLVTPLSCPVDLERKAHAGCDRVTACLGCCSAASTTHTIRSSDLGRERVYGRKPRKEKGMPFLRGIRNPSSPILINGGGWIAVTVVISVEHDYYIRSDIVICLKRRLYRRLVSLKKMGDPWITIIFHHGGLFVTERDRSVNYSGGQISELPRLDVDTVDTNKGIVHVYYEHGVSEPVFDEKIKVASSKGKELIVLADPIPHAYPPSMSQPIQSPPHHHQFQPQN